MVQILKFLGLLIWTSLLCFIIWGTIHKYRSSRRNWRNHMSELAAQGRLLSVNMVSQYSGGVFIAQDWQGFPGWWEIRFTPVEYFPPGKTMEMVNTHELRPDHLEDLDRSFTITGLPRWCRLGTLKTILLTENPEAVFDTYIYSL